MLCQKEEHRQVLLKTLEKSSGIPCTIKIFIDVTRKSDKIFLLQPVVCVPARNVSSKIKVINVP